MTNEENPIIGTFYYEKFIPFHHTTSITHHRHNRRCGFDRRIGIVAGAGGFAHNGCSFRLV
jgi:hypothetical protein